MIYKPCLVVAEAGCNHMGEIALARQMIRMAKKCNVEYIKFQKRTPEICVSTEMQHKTHPDPSNSFGETYLLHRQKLEFTIEQHKELKELCDTVGIKYACSVWDKNAAKEIIQLKPDYIKIPSPMNADYDLIDLLLQQYAGDVHISLGMSTKKERNSLIKYLIPHKNRITIYWTTSGYPVSFEELYLLEIPKLTKIFPSVGYSGHNLGISVDIAAYTLGASWIERHFTMDRTLKGTDHAASLEPTGLEKLKRNLVATFKALTFKKRLTREEVKNRKKLRNC